jgi:ABC-type sugar transport system ATPase subunit
MGREGRGDLDRRQVINDLPPRRRNITRVFQHYAVFPHLSVYDNIAFGLRMHEVARSNVNGRVQRAAGLVELSEYLERRPSQLSGASNSAYPSHVPL